MCVYVDTYHYHTITITITYTYTYTHITHVIITLSLSHTHTHTHTHTSRISSSHNHYHIHIHIHIHTHHSYHHHTITITITYLSQYVIKMICMYMWCIFYNSVWHTVCVCDSDVCVCGSDVCVWLWYTWCMCIHDARMEYLGGPMARGSRVKVMCVTRVYVIWYVWCVCMSDACVWFCTNEPCICTKVFYTLSEVISNYAGARFVAYVSRWCV